MSKPINIILAAPGKGVGKGGVVRQMQYLYEEGESHDEIQFHWLCTHSNNALWPLFFIGTCLKLLWLTATQNIDFIHLNIASKGSFYRKWMLYKIAHMLGIHHIAHLHGGGFQVFYDAGSATRKARIKDLFTNAAQVLVLGKVWAEFATSLGVEKSKLTLLPNAVPTPPEASQGGGDTPHIIFVGHLLPRKGVGELIDALAELKDLEWHATLAGSGELEHYQQQVAIAELNDRITFAGWLDDSALNQLYQNADILLLPSHIENQPLSILEAMAHGLAIISTDVGTVKEITNKNTAIVTELSYKAISLIPPLKGLLESPKKRREYAAKARKYHLENQSILAYFDAYKSTLVKL